MLGFNGRGKLRELEKHRDSSGEFGSALAVLCRVFFGELLAGVFVVSEHELTGAAGCVRKRLSLHWYQLTTLGMAQRRR